MKKIIAILPLLVIALVIFALPVSAAYTLFGEASIVAGGNPGMALQTVSDSDPGFGGASFDNANGTLFSSLATLSTDYNVTDDDCGGGSPRFQVRIDVNGNGTYEPFPGGDGNIFVYVGPSPSFTNCPTGWQSSGNLVGNNDAGRWSSEQVGGTNSGTYAQALAAAGTKNILSISLLIDSGWSSDASGGDGEQTVLFDNVTINSAVETFEPAATASPSASPSPTINPNIPTECSGMTFDNVIEGTSGSDDLEGTSKRDLILGRGGNDEIDGSSNNDCIVAGGGDDEVESGSGNDVVLGEAGKDKLEGGSGNDDLYGGGNEDKLEGGSGNDNAWGEGGNDNLDGGSGNDDLIGGSGTDRATGGSSSDACDAETESSCETNPA